MIPRARAPLVIVATCHDGMHSMATYVKAEDVARLFDMLAVLPRDALTTSTDVVARALREIGVDPAIVHAFDATGMLVSEDGVDLWSARELRRWHAAIRAYAAMRARR